MTSQSQFVQRHVLRVAPHSFALDEEAESILGDLMEEFSLLASKSGVPFARLVWRRR